MSEATNPTRRSSQLTGGGHRLRKMQEIHKAVGAFFVSPRMRTVYCPPPPPARDAGDVSKPHDMAIWRYRPSRWAPPSGGRLLCRATIALRRSQISLEVRNETGGSAATSAIIPATGPVGTTITG
jgi:hypothetical protein